MDARKTALAKGAAVSSFATVVGQKGDKGDAGIPGQNGSDGLPGQKGDKGDPGTPGQNGTNGTNGSDGAPGSTGPVGMSWKGTWSGSTAYVATDGVSSEGSSYICLSPHTNQQPPNASYWSLLASKGDQGIQGTQGSQGTQGPAGEMTQFQALKRISLRL